MTTPAPPTRVQRAAEAREASASAPASAPATTRVFDRLRKATDRVPTGWFAAIGTGLFLAVTAAFGGLSPIAEKPAPPPAALGAGETHTGEQLAVTVQRAVLIDELDGSGAYPDPGERVLTLLVELENQWTQPLDLGSATTHVVDSVLLSGDDRTAVGVVREDDQTYLPTLQPGVPALLAFSWTVPAGRYQDGDDLQVVLGDSPLHTLSFLTTGTSWGAPETAAIVTLPVEDVGAGAGADAAEATS